MLSLKLYFKTSTRLLMPTKLYPENQEIIYCAQNLKSNLPLIFYSSTLLIWGLVTSSMRSTTQILLKNKFNMYWCTFLKSCQISLIYHFILYVLVTDVLLIWNIIYYYELLLFPFIYCLKLCKKKKLCFFTTCFILSYYIVYTISKNLIYISYILILIHIVYFVI